jgi:hypothetical protein
MFFNEAPMIDDSEEVQRIDREYWDRLYAADDFADFLERQAMAESEEWDGEEDDWDDHSSVLAHEAPYWSEPEPPATPAASAPSTPARAPLWSVMLSGSAGRIAPSNAESRAARRQRRRELDRAA